MAVTNLYPNLPGHLVEFKDGGLQLTSNTETASGKSLLILGTAFDGPINEPVQIDSTTVSQLFGSEVNEKGYPNGATLTKYAKQAFKNGFTDVRCMRVTGSQAYVNISKTTEESSENIDATPVSGTIQGNSAVSDLELTHKPIIGDTLVVTTSSDVKIATSGYTEYEGVFGIAAGVISKNSTIYANYQYKDIDSTAKTSTVNASTDGVAYDTVTLDFDPAANQAIYVTPKDALGNYVDTTGKYPLTDGVKVTKEVTEDGSTNTVTLVEGTDYVITGNVLSFVDGGAVALTDESINIEYYVYTLSDGSDTFKLSNDVDQTVTLPKTPVEGSIVLTVNGTVAETSTYSVADNTVTLVAGNFTINDTYVITYQYEEVTTVSEGMTVRAIYGGSVYKDASIVVTEITDEDGNVGRKFTFTKPESKKYSNADKPFYFTSFECPTVGMLKQALANYALNNVFEIVTDNEDATTADFPVFSGTLSNGGDDGVVVTNNQMFEALAGKRDADGYLIEQGAYQILENYNVDYIYPAGIYADSKQTVNPNSSFHYELALLCAVLTYRTKMTHGFIDVKPNSNTTLVGIQKYVYNLLKYNNIH